MNREFSIVKSPVPVEVIIFPQNLQYLYILSQVIENAITFVNDAKHFLGLKTVESRQ